MEQLLIQFADAELASFRWAVIDDQGGTLEIDWQMADESGLSAIATQNPHPVTLLVPQQNVYLTQVELPEKAGRQVLSAIEYQIEDQLAQDIETQHFALGDTSENPISIAVVEKSVMDRCLALSRSHGLRLLQILPEVFLCPRNDGVSLLATADGWLVRYGAYRGLKCSAAALPAMLQLVKRDFQFDTVNCYTGSEGSLPEIKDVELMSLPLSSASPGFVDAPVIELQQRDYQMSSRWKSLGKTWKWIGIILAALLVVGAYNKAIALQKLETELTELRQQQFELVKPYLADDVTLDDNLKKLLIERMKSFQAGQGEQGFMQLLAEFTDMRKQYPNVKITRIGYQNKRMNIDISDQQLQTIELLEKKLLQKGISAKLENLSIKPELISARLVLRGGEDG